MRSRAQRSCKTSGENQSAGRATEKTSALGARLHPITVLQQTIGNQAVLRLLSALSGPLGPDSRIQAKLGIGTPGDVHEQEANRVVDAVMLSPSEHPAAQLKSHSATAVRGLYRESDSAERHEKESGPPPGKRAVKGESAIGGMSGGHPLSPAERAFFEPRFGHDFSPVRIHTGAVAAQLAGSVHAHAFTLGDDIVFNTGRYSPETEQGKRLLAHELTHVVQQGGAARAIQRQSADEYTFGEIGSWGIVSLRDFSAPAGLADAKASIGAVCRPDTCRSASGAHATAPGDQHSWQNITAAAGGTNQSGGGTLMCVGTQGCGFVHQCTRCHGTAHETVERTAAGGANLSPTGTTAVAGYGTLYFYVDALQGWCNAADRQSGCRPQARPPHGTEH